MENGGAIAAYVYPTTQKLQLDLDLQDTNALGNGGAIAIYSVNGTVVDLGSLIFSYTTVRASKGVGSIIEYNTITDIQ